MIRIGKSAALCNRKVMRWTHHTIRIRVAEPARFPIGAGNPAEEVVERPVLHRDDDDMVDASRLVEPVYGVFAPERDCSCKRRSAYNELPSIDQLPRQVRTVAITGLWSDASVESTRESVALS